MRGVHLATLRPADGRGGATMKTSGLEDRTTVRGACSVPLLVALCVVAADRAATQAPSPADGPWAGWAQCQVMAQFVGQGQTYLHQQTHTWVLTGTTPVPSSAAIKSYPATWQVIGQGTRQRGQSDRTEQWTTAGQPMPDTITIRLSGDGLLHIGGAAQLRSVGTTTGAVIPYVDEWPFPAIVSGATLTSIAGSAPSAVPANFPGAPAGTSSTVTCSWNFVRGGGVPPPPPRSLEPLSGQREFKQGLPISLGPSPQTPPATPQRSITRDQAAPPVALAGAIGAPVDPVGAIGVLTEPMTCQMAGPAIQSPVQATPARAYLQWAAAPGATGYTVARNDIGVLTTAPIQATTFIHNAPFDYRIPYTYTVTAQYRTGCGTSRVTVTAPRPGTPTVVGVSAINGNMAARTGGVRISWNLEGSDATGYLVLGPGLPQNGREILAPLRSPTSTLGTSLGFVTTDGAKTAPLTHQVEINSVPAGTHTWLIAPFWNTPTGRVIDVNTGARATAKVGFYRVLITGVRVDHETVDNPLSVDGQGDEIYVAAAAYLSGDLVAIGKSSVYGDDSPLPLVGDFLGIFVPPTGIRIRAGTAGFTGGLRTGNSIPFPDPSLPVGPPSSTTFPFVVWEGWLGGGTELVVKPTIWEWDGDLTYYNEWSSLMRGWTTRSDSALATTQSAVQINSFQNQLLQLNQTQSEEDRLYKEELTRVRADRTASRDGRTSRPGYDRAIGGTSSAWMSVHADNITPYDSLVDIYADRAPAAAPTPTTTAALRFIDTADLAGRYTMFVLLQQVP